MRLLGTQAVINGVQAQNTVFEVLSGSTLSANGLNMDVGWLTGIDGIDSDQMSCEGSNTFADAVFFGLDLWTFDGSFADLTDVEIDASTVHSVDGVTTAQLTGDTMVRHSTVDIQNTLSLTGVSVAWGEDLTVTSSTGTGRLDSEAGIEFVFFSGENRINDVEADILGTVTVEDEASFVVSGDADVSMALALINGRIQLERGDVGAALWTLLSGGAIVADPVPEGGGPNRIAVVDGFTFEMTDEASWSWAPGTILELTGGVGARTSDFESWTHLEVGGADVGADAAGFDDNFDLAVLRLGPGAHAYLEDAVDNGNRGSIGREALYVDTLEFADGAGLLNLNGLHLAYGALIGDPAQIIDEPVAPCAGDLNGDGVTDTVDLLAMLGAWGPCAECAADLDADGFVNVVDLLVLLGAWGPCQL